MALSVSRFSFVSDLESHQKPFLRPKFLKHATKMRYRNYIILRFCHCHGRLPQISLPQACSEAPPSRKEHSLSARPPRLGNSPPQLHPLTRRVPPHPPPTHRPETRGPRRSGRRTDSDPEMRVPRGCGIDCD